jgi:hypothetical protein
MSFDPVNFKAWTGNTFDFQIDYFTDETEAAAVNLTGYTVACKVRDSAQTIYGNSSVGTAGIAMVATIASPATDGIINISAVPATTLNWPVGKLYYDVQLTHTATGTKKVIVEGEIRVKPGLT